MNKIFISGLAISSLAIGLGTGCSNDPGPRTGGGGGQIAVAGTGGGTIHGGASAVGGGGTASNGGAASGGTATTSGGFNAGGASGTGVGGGIANGGGGTGNGGTNAVGGTGPSGGGTSGNGGSAGDGVGANGGGAGAFNNVTCTGSNPVSQSFKVGLTYYSQTSANNCGVPWPSDGMYLALSTDLYDKPGGSGACGKCVSIKGKTLLVVDQCPAATNQPCTSTHLDLSPQAYQAVQGSTNPGQVSNGSLDAKFVPCPVTGNIVYHVGTLNMYYAAFVIMKAPYAIKSVSYRVASSSDPWTAMPSPTDMDPHWIINGVTIPKAMDFLITSEWGQVLLDANVQLKAGDVPGGIQFPTCP